MRSGQSGARAREPVVHLVWRELDDARAFVKFLSWVAMVPERKYENAIRKIVKVSHLILKTRQRYFMVCRSLLIE